MRSDSSYLVFCGAAIALLVVPGPAVAYIVTTSANRGRTAGLVSVAGIHTGTLVHLFAALVGLSALLVTSATAFNVVRYLGAAYLIVLGIRTLLARVDAGEVAGPPPRSLRRIWADGVVVNVLNPKTALFFMAFLPQFVDPDAPGARAWLALLGLTFIVLGIISDGMYALAGGWVGQRWAANPLAQRRRNLAAGVMYLVLGALALLSGPRRTA